MDMELLEVLHFIEIYWVFILCDTYCKLQYNYNLIRLALDFICSSFVL
jgi:hypothetical protein